MTEEEERSLIDELAAVAATDRWEGPVYLTGSVAHLYPECDDMKQTAKPYHSIDPYARRPDGVNACRYCVEKWESELQIGKEERATTAD